MADTTGNGTISLERVLDILEDMSENQKYNKAEIQSFVQENKILDEDEDQENIDYATFMKILVKYLKEQ
jgi:Ca2+-binding EF-hand superfamily protein